MGKLFNLKEWLTVPETARHLSNVCAEDVTEADVFRLALDGHLKLSINFASHASGRRGKVNRVTPEYFHEKKPELETQPIFLDIGKSVTFSDVITPLFGIWDLPLIGSERSYIENKYNLIINGPEMTLVEMDRLLVESLDGEWIVQLRKRVDNNEYQPMPAKEFDELPMLSSNKIDGVWVREDRILSRKNEADLELIKEAEESSRVFYELFNKPINNYHPANDFPNDSTLVVRTAAIRAFERSINGEQPEAEKPLTTKERNGLLTVIAALCDYSAVKYNERGAAGQIAKMTDEIGAPVGEETIKGYLDKIQYALGTRKK